MLPSVLFLLSVAAANNGEWWEKDHHCPAGTNLVGKVNDRLTCKHDNGSIHGPFTLWDNGVRVLDKSYVDGIEHGAFLAWWTPEEAGAPFVKMQEGTYISGEREGVWIEWYPNGRVRNQGNYFQGMMHGTFFWWDIAGNQVGTVRMHMGTGWWTEWYESGDVRAEGEYLSGEKHGKWTVYHANGRLWMEDHYDHGLRHGVFTEYYDHGKKRDETTYKHGVPHGSSIHWDAKGVQVSLQHFDAKDFAM